MHLRVVWIGSTLYDGTATTTCCCNCNCGNNNNVVASFLHCLVTFATQWHIAHLGRQACLFIGLHIQHFGWSRISSTAVSILISLLPMVHAAAIGHTPKALRPTARHLCSANLRSCGINAMVPMLIPPARPYRDLLLPALAPAGISVGAHRCRPRQTDSRRIRRLLPVTAANRAPTYSKKLTSL